MMHDDLHQLQSNFQKYLLSKDDEIHDHIKGTQKVSAAIRLSIYGDAYFLRLREVLQKDFPGILHLLGEEAFTEMARVYVRLFPSHFRSIRWFGQYLPLFLSKEKPYATHEILFEMAKFEWLLTESFDCENTMPLTLEKLQQIPAQEWPTLCFLLCPSLRRMSTNWNIIQIWKSITNKEDVNQIIPERSSEPTQWIIWRKAYEVQFRSLSNLESIALNTIQEGRPFAELCEAIYPYVNENEAALCAASFLKRWISEELITE